MQALKCSEICDKTSFAGGFRLTHQVLQLYYFTVSPQWDIIFFLYLMFYLGIIFNTFCMKSTVVKGVVDKKLSLDKIKDDTGMEVIFFI